MTSPTSSPAAVIDAYIEGTRTRDVSLLQTIFADGAVMSGWLGLDHLMGGPEPFYGALQANEVGPDYAATVTALHQDGPIATAHLSEQNLLGLAFENHFHMVQNGDDAWQITAKLFRHS